eukprot:SAG22_NODE_463_length_10196_cov_4.491928_10_plen_135_part_00
MAVSVQHQAVLRESCRLLFQLGDHHQAIVAAGGVACLVACLEDLDRNSDPAMAEAACGALGSLALGGLPNREAIVEAGGVAALVKVLNSHGLTSRPVRASADMCLELLASPAEEAKAQARLLREQQAGEAKKTK